MTNYYHDGADRLTREFEILRPIAYIPFEWSAFETLQICLVFMFSFFFFFCFQTKPTTVFCDQRYRYYIHITVYRKKKKKMSVFFMVALALINAGKTSQMMGSVSCVVATTYEDSMLGLKKG